MDEYVTRNYAVLKGVLASPPRFSHLSRGERFYTFPVETRRLSGVTDTINVIARESLLTGVEVEEAGKICVTGELRSFNNKRGEGAKLVITVFAKTLSFDGGEDINTVSLDGTLCKEPTHRLTPMGREICDLMLAVNRRYGETRQALYSYRLRFPFPTDAGMLNYLRDREFTVEDVPFRDRYFSRP